MRVAIAAKIAMLALGCASAQSSGALPPELNGRGGASLRAEIARVFAPKSFLPVADNCIDIRGGNSRTEFFDPFSGATVGYSPEISYDGILPVSYWSISPARERAAADLYNHIPFTPEVSLRRADLPPGNVETITWTNGIWSTGTVAFYDMPVEFYNPPAEYRGDFARVIFYMAALYPTDSWSLRAFTLMDGSDYPVLNKYARETLLKYHRDDPVSAEELRRAGIISKLQGNQNPFVEYPLLAEYLWGERQGELIDIPDAPVPLRSTYRITDSRIDLLTPYAPADSRWSVDGTAVTASWLSPSGLGMGKHQLRFYSPSTGAQGMLTIIITE